MIRKLLLASILAIGFSNAALAQNVQCANRPSGDSTNACANTRFVQDAISGAGGSPGGTNGQIQYNDSGDFGGFTASGDATVNTSTGAVTVTKSNGVAFGTAAFASTGTSGHTIPYLDGTNTWSGNQTFGAGNLIVTGGSGCATFTAGILGSTGSACGSGGGTPGGTNGQIQYNNGGVFGGLTATSVNIVDYGAIPSDITKAAINQTAIQNALASGDPVYCPAGQTFYTQPVTIPSGGSQVIYGGCNLIAAGTATALGVLYGDSLTNFTVHQVNVDGSPIGVDGVRFTNNTNLLIEGITANGANAIDVVSSTGTVIRNNTVPTYSNIGIECSDCTITKILHNSVTNVVGGTIGQAPFFCIQVAMSSPTSPGSNVEITGNIITGCGTSFGINVNGNGGGMYDGIVISNNQVTDTTVESINLAVVQNFVVSNNVVKFITSTPVDQGIDVWGPVGETAINGLFVGNTVVNACAGGIALDQNVSGVTITGNTIINAANCKSTAGNANAAIILWNGQHNSVFGNTIVDPNANMQWAVNEYNDGVATAPDYNTIGENATTNGSLGRYNLVGANSTMGEGCVYQQGTSTCNGNPATQTATYGAVNANGAISATHSTNGNLLITATNTDAGSSAVAALAATSNAGSVLVQANSTAAGGTGAVIAGIPLTVGSSGHDTNLGTSGTVRIDAAGLMVVSPNKFELLGSSSGTTVVNAPATGGGTATFFPGTDTVAGLAATQTLTNKTIDCSLNTCSNIRTNTPLVGGGSNSTIAASATGYIGLGSICASESACLITPSIDGTISNLGIAFQGPPGGSATYTVTLRINFVDTALTCTVTSAVSGCSDTTHSVAFSNGSIASIKVVNSSGGATITSSSWGLKYTTTSP